MKKSAGIILIKNNKILLCHPTNAPWFGTFSFPKGTLEKNENTLDAAIRETHEEVGILIDKKDISDYVGIIDYLDKNGKLYKKVYYYIAHVNNISDVIPKTQLQLEEVDYACFYNYEEAKEKIFHRFDTILNLIKNEKN